MSFGVLPEIPMRSSGSPGVGPRETGFFRNATCWDA
jgi:hypothetical protein